MDRLRWVRTVDRLMLRDWCIDTAGAGLNDADLTRYWQGGDEPAMFVSSFAKKYDLIRFEQYPMRPGRA